MGADTETEPEDDSVEAQAAELMWRMAVIEERLKRPARLRAQPQEAPNAVAPPQISGGKRFFRWAIVGLSIGLALIWVARICAWSMADANMPLYRPI